MIEALFSLKIVLIFLISILILDELFVGIQTTETVNFFALRANLVDQDTNKVDDFYNKTILKFLIFTKHSPFLSIQNIQTIENQQKQLTTSLHYASPFRWNNQIENSFTISTMTKEIQKP